MNDINFNCVEVYVDNVLSEEDIENNLYKVKWEYISLHQRLSEGFIERHLDELFQRHVFIKNEVSEEFIIRNMFRLDLWNICRYQVLSEEFIDHYIKDIYFDIVLEHQNLSEEYLENNISYIDISCIGWSNISLYQKLSESFMDKYFDKLDSVYISRYQKLSEGFIERHIGKLRISDICKYQKLSEGFIERNINYLDLLTIGEYQILSKEFREKHNIYTQNCLWLYKDNEFKRDYIRKHTEYELVGDKVIAYKSCRRSGYSRFNFQYHYVVDGEYESTADSDPDEINSFGLSAWTKDRSLDYCREKLFKVEIDLEDLACINREGKIRARKIKILEEVKI